MAQNNEKYISLWSKVDSFTNAQLPGDAQKIIDQILLISEKDKAFDHYMKAFVMKNKLNYGSEEGVNKYIADNMQLIQIANTDVQKAIVYAFLAREINNYFEANRYEIYNRTNIKSANEAYAIDEWTEQQFIDTIYNLYDRALALEGSLHNVSMDQYDVLFVETNSVGKSDIQSLLEFILNDYKDFNLENINTYSKNFKQYTTNDTAWLTLDPSIFINKKIQSDVDAIDITKRTINAFQKLTAYYQKVNNNCKLAKLDFQRLQFFFDQFLFPNEEKLALETWKKFVAKNSDLSVSAHAQHFIISNNLQDSLLQPKGAVAAYESLINKFPYTAESEFLYNQINNLTSRNLNIKLEETVQPNLPFKILITYKNVPSIKFKIVHYLPQKNNESNLEHIKRISKQPTIASYSVELPAYDDLKQHRVEFKIDPLPIGRYIIINEALENDNNYYNWIQSEFQVSNLGFVQQEEVLTVLDRTTGAPIKNAMVSFKSNNITKQLITDANGVIILPNLSNRYDYYNELIISYKNDTYYAQFGLNVSSNNSSKEQVHYFIFTDRAIYRPGQEVFFKVIAVTKNGNVINVLPNEKIEIALSNNYAVAKKDQKIKLTTNEFGSVQGSIKAPENGFLGMYFLHVNNTSTNIRIEEYKRPTFTATFDSLKGNYVVNKPITISGLVKSYAGNVINDASVTYTINRVTRFPFPWRCIVWPMQHNNTTIASGTVTTDENGKFNFSFLALPDNTNPDYWPVFNYEVAIKVSDINGETHEYTQQVAAAYRDAIPSLDIPEDATIVNLQKVNATVTNVNGIPIQNPYTITVAKLDAPKQLIKERLWELPDQYLYNEAKFKSFFPNEAYKNELDKNTWNIKKITFTQSYQHAQEIDFIKEKAMPENGWYKITIQAKDNNGLEVTQQYFIHALVDNKAPIEKPIAIASNSSTIEPGQKIITSIKTISKSITPQVIFKTPTNRRIDDSLNFVVAEEDRGGIYYKSYFIKDNRYYEAIQFVNVPFTNKQLKIHLQTKRDKLLPGSKEVWSFSISDYQNTKIPTEFLASMYDYSLDMITPAQWNYYNLMNGMNSYFSSSNNLNKINDVYFNLAPIDATLLYQKAKNTSLNATIYSFRNIGWYPYFNYNFYNYRGQLLETVQLSSPRMRSAKSVDVVDSMPVSDPTDASTINASVNKNDESSSNSPNAPFVPRSNFNETAFFYPNLRTNEKGDISFEFTMPEALTTWKWRTFAHTKDWKLAYLEGIVTTQKDLMVQPNIPRAFRQGDEVVLSTKVANLTNELLETKVWIEILNAQTLQSLNVPFGFTSSEQHIKVPGGQSQAVNWNIKIPESIYEPVILRVFATSGKHTDGEEHYIPVLTNRMLVTETKPLPMIGNGTKNFEISKLKLNNSTTLTHKGITVEYTANPTWYVVQALPYLASYPYDCAEQIFSRVYANAIADDIIKKAPQIESVFNTWKTSDTAALLSNLLKNEQLKTAILEETPWVLEAQDETAQKQRIAALFETKKLSNDLQKSIQQLSKKQLDNGAFPWFEGMNADRYITQTIALGILKMKAKNIVVANDNQLVQIVSKSMQYLESKLAEDYKYLIDKKIKLDQQNITAIQIQYLYAHALSGKPIPDHLNTAYSYYLQQVKSYWKEQNILLQAYCAEMLNINKDQQTALLIIESLRQRANKNEELGMYWQHNKNYYYWQEAPIETQAAVIEAFKKIDPRATEIAQMQTWLIKNKQTNRWHSTKATVEACYALLSSNNKLLAQQPNVLIQLGNTITDNTKSNAEAGTGYFITNIDGKDVNKNMGDIKVTVSESTEQLPSWGAVYWQYFEQYDKISVSNNALQIKKEIFIAKSSETGEALHAITSRTPIEIGDKIVVRMVVTTDRNVEYVHIKDTRAACFEPKDALSKYQYKSGLGYYQSTKDISTNFFIDYLAKGTYVLEYVVYANAKGTYSSGIASIQCMYAPEFTSHSQGEIIEVK